MEQNSILHTTLSLDSDIPLYAQLVGIIKRSISTCLLYTSPSPRDTR